jgi:hypothetical protein
VTRFALLRLALLCAALFSAPRAGAQNPAPAATGAISGIVLDEAGKPLANARVTIEALARQTRTNPEGEFSLANIPAGEVALSVRQVGFRAANATLQVVAGSTINVQIRLVLTSATLDAVVVRESLLNQINGMVVDENDNPIGGVVVEVLGSNRRVFTDSTGRYLLVDLQPGSYLLQFRAMGYRVSQYGVRMVAQIDRDITTRLRPFGANDRLSVELAAVVALEANRRQGMRGGRSVIIGREQLERFDRAPLSVALAGTEAAIVLPDVNTACILVDGHEPASTLTARSNFEGPSTRRGPVSINPNGTSRSAPSAGPQSAGVGGWLSFFRANEVELVEIYPVGSDNSRTLCGRFPPSSGCACPPEPSGIVIWLSR